MKIADVIWILMTQCCLFPSVCDALTCLSCDSIVLPVECTTVQRCGSGEVCYGERRLDNSSHVTSFRLGCRNAQLCPVTDAASTDVLGKRGETRQTSGVTVLEERCCNTDLCNDVVGNTPGYKIPRGPLCYDCPEQAGFDDCGTITLCQTTEVCGIFSDINNARKTYRTSCLNPGVCARVTQLVGKKRSFMECFHCCDNDLCNDRCVDCTSNPCVHGTCRSARGGYECTCHQGYTGEKCDAPDPCHPNPCVNGTCSQHNGTMYLCTCEFGFTGRHCDTYSIPDPCSSNPCVAGSCQSKGPVYSCTCLTGWAGTNCEKYEPVSACLPNPCVHGNCSDDATGFLCTCEAGYRGPLCDQYAIPDPCHSKPCVNGVCSNNAGHFKCTCNHGYDGTRCEHNVLPDPCLSNPCLNGLCSNNDGHFKCTCNHGYNGTRCEHNALTDQCLSNPCKNGQCSIDGTHFKCTCNQGYDGKYCEHNVIPDPCHSNPCVNGLCLPFGAHYTCTCYHGYSGTHCDHKIPTACVDATSSSTCAIAASLVCGSRDTAGNAHCLHYCGFC